MYVHNAHNCENRSLIKIQFESRVHSSTAFSSLLLREIPNILWLQRSSTPISWCVAASLMFFTLGGIVHAGVDHCVQRVEEEELQPTGGPLQHPLASGTVRWRWRSAAQLTAGEASVEGREHRPFKIQVHSWGGDHQGLAPGLQAGLDRLLVKWRFSQPLPGTWSFLTSLPPPLLAWSASISLPSVGEAGTWFPPSAPSRLWSPLCRCH